MGNPAGVKRDFEDLERRRTVAAQLLQRGVSQAEVARRLGVHRQSVIRWVRELRKSGRAGLKRAGRAGRKAKLSAADLQALEQALKRGPQALGYETALWTAPRVARLIAQLCGVRYHPAHVWRLGTVGLELPAPCRSRAGARRRSHPALEEVGCRGVTEQKPHLRADEGHR